MQLLIYILAYPFLWFISILPFPLVYFISDIVYIFIYKIFGYRRKVVRSNLKLVFPEKDYAEIIKIEQQFYSHLCDMFLEMIKTLSISEEEMQKRFTFKNIEEIQSIEKEKSVLLMFPHYASWEWVIALNKHIDSKGYAVYQRIKNKRFDQLVRRLREKFGTTLIEAKETPAIILSNQRKNIKSMYGFLSDQSPTKGQAKHWYEFMNVKVPVHTGAETLGKRLGLAVVYLKVEKVKRGHYIATFKTLAKNPEEFSNYKITELFVNEMEAQIRENPAYYFWTHKRWKHKDAVPEEFR